MNYISPPPTHTPRKWKMTCKFPTQRLSDHLTAAVTPLSCRKDTNESDPRGKRLLRNLTLVYFQASKFTGLYHFILKEIKTRTKPKIPIKFFSYLSWKIVCRVKKKNPNKTKSKDL